MNAQGRRHGVAITLSLALLAGCGGDTEPQAQSPTPRATTEQVTRAAYIKQADEICRQRDQEIKGSQARLDRLIERNESKAAATEIRNVVRSARTFLRTRREAERPLADEDTLEMYYDDVAQELGVSSSLADAVEQEDLARINTLADEVRLLRERVKGAARTYGFKDCGRA